MNSSQVSLQKALARALSLNSNSPATVGQVKSKGKSRAARRRKAQNGNGITINGGIPIAQRRAYSNVPAQISSKGNTTVITHRELIGVVAASYNYANVLNLELNPGLMASFPWLSRLARCYEEYSFTSLKFRYTPSCSATETGTVYMAVDYDVSDPLPATEIEASSYAGMVCTQAYSGAVMDCPVSRQKGLSNIKYIRHSALPANQDNKTYDLGRLIVGVVGDNSGEARIGTVTVEYTVNLITPGIATDAEEEASLKMATTNGTTPQYPFGDGAGLIQGLDNPVASLSQDTITFNEPGEYCLDLNWLGTVFTGGAPALTGTATKIRLGGIVNAAATGLWESWLVKTTAPGMTLIASLAAVATSISRVDLRMKPYKYTFQ